LKKVLSPFYPTLGAASDCEPFRQAIELGLSHGRNAMAIWQDLVADHGFQAGYAALNYLHS
jgi:hypothetical protein